MLPVPATVVMVRVVMFTILTTPTPVSPMYTFPLWGCTARAKGELSSAAVARPPSPELPTTPHCPANKVTSPPGLPKSMALTTELSATSSVEILAAYAVVVGTKNPAEAATPPFPMHVYPTPAPLPPAPFPATIVTLPSRDRRCTKVLL